LFFVLFFKIVYNYFMESIFIIDDNINTLNTLEVSFIMSGFKTNICFAEQDKEIIIRTIEKEKPDYLLLNLSLKTKNAFELLDYIFQKNIEFKDIFVYDELINRELIKKCEKYNLKNFIDKSGGISDIVEKIISIIKNKNKKYD